MHYINYSSDFRCSSHGNNDEKQMGCVCRLSHVAKKLENGKIMSIFRGKLFHVFYGNDKVLNLKNTFQRVSEFH